MNPFGDDVSAVMHSFFARRSSSPAAVESLLAHHLFVSFLPLPFLLLSSPPFAPGALRKQLDFGDGDPFDDEYDDDDFDGAGGDAVRHYGAEHVLLLFDCDASMFERYVPCHRTPSSNDDDGDNDEDVGVVYYSPMDVATTAAHRLLRAKVRDVAETKSGTRDGVGVVLYGCDPNRPRCRGRGRIRREGHSDGGGGGGRDDGIDDDDDCDGGDDDPLPTTHELIELVAPGTEQVLTMQECIPNDDDGRRRRDLRYEFSLVPRGKEEGDGPGGAFGGEEGGDEVCSLRRGLTAALKIFSSAKCVRSSTPASKQPPDSKAVWIFTNQDDPCRGNEIQRTRMSMLRRDCQEAGVAIHLLPMPKDNGSFDRNIFYNDLVTPSNDGEETTMDSSDDYDNVEKMLPAPLVDIDAILEKFVLGTRKRRKYATLPLLLPGWGGDGPGDCPGIMLDLYGVVQVRNKPQKLSVHQENNKMTIRRTIRIIAESGEEVQPENIHHFADFCGRVSLPPENVATMKRLSNSLDKAGLIVHGFRPMKFLNATNLMSNAVLAMANDFRVRGSGRALYNLKRSMKKKKVFAVGELLLRATATSRMVAMIPKDDDSDWFVITQLPFREDVRDVPDGNIGLADRDSVDAAKKLVSKSTLRFDDFASCLPENPFLKHFFGYLESVSLGNKLGRVDDDTRMDFQSMMKNSSEEIKSFSSILPEDEQPVKIGRKRKAPPPSSKDRDLKNESIGQEWIDMYKNAEIFDLKIDELKAFLKSQGERLSGKKIDLVERIHRCIEREVFKES